MAGAVTERQNDGVWGMEIRWVDVDEIVPNPENPNQQDDRTFNALVREMEREGWTQPLQVVEQEDGQYQIVAGEHRWRAARILQWRCPVIVLPREAWEQDRRDMVMVKDNLLKGRLNPEKFTALYNRLAERYDGEVLQTLMGFTSEDAFKRVYQQVKRNLPPGLRDALARTKDEIKTIDDLSLVLNKLFREHGETLDSNYMVFSYGGRDVLWVRADKDLWKTVTGIAEEARVNGEGAETAFARRLEHGATEPVPTPTG